jgi:NADPH:quinone reductase-like Zn-dependent oxidoreductase
MAAPVNRALWQDSAGAPGAVRDSPFPSHNDLGDHKILVKVYAWAINPCDYMLQDRNMGNYPVILGCDVAGTVAAVAPGSTAGARFRVGDRVFGFSANNGFQDYVTLEDRLAAKVPEDMAYRDAVVLGLCAATSAMFLFGEHDLHLDYPRLGTTGRGESVLVWGGSSAVGSNAIQLAAAAGYHVITTCSRKNFDYVKGLGAAHVFDYKDANITDEVAEELNKRPCAGIFMAAGLKDGNDAACKVAAASKHRGVGFASSNFIVDLVDVPDEVSVKQPSAENLKPFPLCWFETTAATFEGYMAEALAAGVYVTAPPPLVVNSNGLQGIQEAVDIMRAISQKGGESTQDISDREKKIAEEATAFPQKLVVEQSPATLGGEVR